MHLNKGVPTLFACGDKPIGRLSTDARKIFFFNNFDSLTCTNAKFSMAYILAHQRYFNGTIPYDFPRNIDSLFPYFVQRCISRIFGQVCILVQQRSSNVTVLFIHLFYEECNSFTIHTHVECRHAIHVTFA